jgi:hypothetical protein
VVGICVGKGVELCVFTGVNVIAGFETVVIGIGIPEDGGVVEGLNWVINTKHTPTNIKAINK